MTSASNTDADRGLVYAFALDGRGGGRAVPPDDLHAATQAARDGSGPPLWLHVDRTAAEVGIWLEAAGIPPLAAEALLAEETGRAPTGSAMGW